MKILEEQHRKSLAVRYDKPIVRFEVWGPMKAWFYYTRRDAERWTYWSTDLGGLINHIHRDRRA